MTSRAIRIVGQEHIVVRPDGAGIPTDTTVPAGIVVEVGGQIVSSSMRWRLGIEEAPEASEGQTNTDSSGQPSITSRWDRVETPSGGRRLIG